VNWAPSFIFPLTAAGTGSPNQRDKAPICLRSTHRFAGLGRSDDGLIHSVSADCGQNGSSHKRGHMEPGGSVLYGSVLQVWGPWEVQGLSCLVDAARALQSQTIGTSPPLTASAALESQLWTVGTEGTIFCTRLWRPELSAAGERNSTHLLSGVTRFRTLERGYVALSCTLFRRPDWQRETASSLPYFC